MMKYVQVSLILLLCMMPFSTSAVAFTELTLCQSSSPVTDIKFSPTESYVSLISCELGKLFVWNTTNRELVGHLGNPEVEILEYVFMGAEEYIVALGNNSQIYFLGPEQLDIVNGFELDQSVDESVILLPTPDERFIVSDEQSLDIFTTNLPPEIQTIEFDSLVVDAKFGPLQDKLAVLTLEQVTILEWDDAQQSEFSTFSLSYEDSLPIAISFSNDGTLIVVGYEDGTTEIRALMDETSQIIQGNSTFLIQRDYVKWLPVIINERVTDIVQLEDGMVNFTGTEVISQGLNPINYHASIGNSIVGNFLILEQLPDANLPHSIYFIDPITGMERFVSYGVLSSVVSPMGTYVLDVRWDDERITLSSFECAFNSEDACELLLELNNDIHGN